VVDFDESLFFSIPLAFVYPFDSCSVLNCSSLVCFSSAGLYWATVPNLGNFTLFGIIIIFNYF